LRGREEAAVFQEGSWTWYEIRLNSVTIPANKSRKPVASFSLLCWVGDKSFITLAGG
jgi:hypothetical protein